MKNWSTKKTFIAFLISWFVINILQAVFTEITSDEAYYTLYGKHLSWGYFDHPPMVGLITHISSLLFSGNLGVRFITVVLQLGTLLFTWQLLDNKDKSTTKVSYFFLIAGSICMFSVYGFMTTPDVPLLFFTAFFLVAYKNYLQKDNWGNVLLITIAMAGLVYSKYQAVLVIGFVILSNLRLLTNYKFWLAGFTALLILTPHFYWQYANNFPSLKYHLVDRSDGFGWFYLVEYIPNQLAVFNPFILGASIYVLIKYKNTNLFERALYFLIIGFIGFFFLTAFRGHVEPHWTIAAAIPMIILLSNHSIEDIKLTKFIRKFIFPSLLLILIARVLLITPLLPNSLRLSGKEAKYKAIGKVAGDMPVIFTGSFQKPALYTFFTGKEAHVVSSIYRQTQFDLWRFDKKFQHKPVFICLEHKGKSTTYKYNGGTFNGFTTSDLQIVNDLKVDFNTTMNSINVGDTISIVFTIDNPTKDTINFNHPEFPVQVCTSYVLHKNISIQAVTLSEPITILKPNEKITRTLKTIVPDLPPKTYQFGISLCNFFGASINSHFIKINVQK